MLAERYLRRRYAEGKVEGREEARAEFNNAWKRILDAHPNKTAAELRQMLDNGELHTDAWTRVLKKPPPRKGKVASEKRSLPPCTGKSLPPGKAGDRGDGAGTTPPFSISAPVSPARGKGFLYGPLRRQHHPPERPAF